jgi:predicted RNA binding protein YcfA (HicA-like mRNA interferase family)
MPAPEINTRKIVSRPERQGWVNIGGGSHDKFKYDARPGVVIVAVGWCCTIHRQVGQLN